MLMSERQTILKTSVANDIIKEKRRLVSLSYPPLSGAP